MMRYSVRPRDQIFVKGYRFLFFSRSMGKTVGKSISKNVYSKYSENLFNHAKQSATDAYKREIQKRD